MTIIRNMMLGDLSKVLDMGLAMHKESSYKDLSFSIPKCTKLIESLIGNSQSFAIVAEVNNEIIGMFAAQCGQYYFSDDYLISDLFLYVKPENRGGTAGVRLINAFKEWADKQEVPMTTIGITTEIDTIRTKGLYESCGFKICGLVMRRV